jgi:hypothetical protein
MKTDTLAALKVRAERSLAEGRRERELLIQQIDLLRVIRERLQDSVETVRAMDEQRSQRWRPEAG